MPPGAATHGNRCQTVAGRTHPWRVTRQRRRHFRRGVLAFAWLSRYRRLNTIFERSKEHLIAFAAIASSRSSLGASSLRNSAPHGYKQTLRSIDACVDRYARRVGWVAAREKRL